MKLQRTLKQRERSSRLNPIGNIDPQSLSRHLDAFQAGHLRDAVNIWEHLEQRDDLLRGVISKRKKSVARHGWAVLPLENLDAAQVEKARAHAAALEHFYRHLECEHAVDEAEKGGFKLLLRQMMDAIGKRFAVHEILWTPEPHPQTGRPRWVSARFRFVPLSFFENTTGQLRFLETDYAPSGRPLEEGGWLITAGEGLMMASATAWMFKQVALDDWLRCSERNGTPGLRGVTAALRDSPEWQALEEALEALRAGQSVVHSASDDIRVLDLIPGGHLPFPQLVERIDRMIAALWRGADLSTLSRDRGYGASLQEKETCALEEDDAELLSETLHRQIDRWVIRHVFGPDEAPLARVKILASKRECTSTDLQIDQFLLAHGAPLSLRDTLCRYGRVVAREGDELLGRAHSTTAAAEATAAPSMSAAPATPPEGAATPPNLAVENRAEPFAHSGPALAVAAQSDPDQSDPAAPGASLLLHNRFAAEQLDWVQLSPYGDFPHARGVQRIDRMAAEGMVARFGSFRGRLGRLFGGVPFYAGHPDLPGASTLADQKAYGWIEALEARADGLYGRVHWSDAGQELIRNAHYKFYSPYWEATEIGKENGHPVYRPVALISVGFTNQPNLPVRPLANTQNAEPSPQPAPATSAGATKAVKAASATNESPAAAAAVRQVLENALAQGRLTPAEEPSWRLRLENDFATTRPLLEQRVPVLRTSSGSNGSNGLNDAAGSNGSNASSCTRNLGVRRTELAGRSPSRDRTNRIQERVLEKMRLGLTYDQAWERVKTEHARWFADMR